MLCFLALAGPSCPSLLDDALEQSDLFATSPVSTTSQPQQQQQQHQEQQQQPPAPPTPGRLVGAVGGARSSDSNRVSREGTAANVR